MVDTTARTATPSGQPIPGDVHSIANSRLTDRGIDPQQVLGQGELGDDVTAAGFYVILGVVAATEKAGQGPTHALARLALHAGLTTEIADSLFLAYNQQSAEEAGHGDKVFGNAYYSMGGVAPSSEQSIVGGGTDPSDRRANPSDLFQPSDDPQQNQKRLESGAAVLGGIEIVALQRAFPRIVAWCERWQHPIASDLLVQIRDVVRPEESRHVLIWRYVFHELVAPKGEQAIDFYERATNAGRVRVGAPELDRATFRRLLGTSAPTPRQLLGKDRPAFDGAAVRSDH